MHETVAKVKGNFSRTFLSLDLQVVAGSWQPLLLFWLIFNALNRMGMLLPGRLFWDNRFRPFKALLR